MTSPPPGRMRDTMDPVIVSSEVKCEVCDGPIRYSGFIEQQKNQSFVCESPYCKQFANERDTLPPDVYKFRLEHHRRLAHQQRSREAKRNRYREKIEQKEIFENQSILENVSSTRDESSVQNPYLVTIPTGRSNTRRLSESRIQTYKSHLQAIIEKAFTEQAVEDIAGQARLSSEKLINAGKIFEENPSLKTVSEHLCATCKGGCCADGGNHAYLTFSSIMRIRGNLPDHSAEEILDEYMSRLSDEPVEDSCINQTQTGCSLPVELRSNVCNIYFCNSVRDLHEKFADEECLTPVLAIRRSNDNWNRFDTSFENQIAEVVLIDGDSARQLKLSRLQLQDIRPDRVNEDS